MSTPAPQRTTPTAATHVQSTLPPESRELAAALAEIVTAHATKRGISRVVVGIAGESGSGKSITASALAHTLSALGHRAALIHQDDYFLLPPRTNHEHRIESLENVGPHEVDLALIRAHITAFRDRRDVTDAPLVDYPANRFVRHALQLSACDTLVVEGTYVLTLPPADIDVRVFLEATHEDTRERRRARNRDIDDPFIDRVLAIEHDIIVRQRTSADVVIDRNFAIHAVT